MDRRAFLRTLGLGAGVAAGLAVDPERLGWVKGARTFFLPSPKLAPYDIDSYPLPISCPIATFNVGERFTINGDFPVNPRTYYLEPDGNGIWKVRDPEQPTTILTITGVYVHEA